MSEKMSGYMNCETFEKNLNAFLDSELDETLRAQMIGHANSCPECAEKLDQMTRMLTMLAEMDEETVMPLAGQAAWRGAIRKEAAAKRRPRLSAWAGTLGTVAAALVLLVAGTFAYRNQGPLSLNNYGALSISSGSTEQGMRPALEPQRMMYDGGAPTGISGGMGMDDSVKSTEIDGPTATPIPNPDAQDTGEAGVPEADSSFNAVIIRSAVREMETTAFDSDMKNLQDLVSEYAGYYERSAVNGQPLQPGESVGRVATMVTRIPSKDLQEFLNSIAVIGKTTYMSENADDISYQYYDVEMRLETYRAQHARLLELIESAETMQDIIALEDKLYDVQNSIDSLEGQLRGWDSQVNYSSVTITLTEVAVRDIVQPIGNTLGDRMRTGFYDSVNWLMGFLQDMSVFLAIIAPQLVIAIPLIVLLIIIVRVVRRKRK